MLPAACFILQVNVMFYQLLASFSKGILGTTGLPKGVRISHWNLMSINPICMSAGDGYRARCEREGRPFVFRTVAHLPMAHIAGIAWYSLNPFYMGGTCYWMQVSLRSLCVRNVQVKCQTEVRLRQLHRVQPNISHHGADECPADLAAGGQKPEGNRPFR